MNEWMNNNFPNTDNYTDHNRKQTSVLSLYLPITVGPLCRSFAKPPKQVQVVCECILVLRGYKEISWQSAKGMMSEASFLRSLMEMDCDSITNNQVGTVKGMSASCLIETLYSNHK